jgi:hypothetical protein
MEIKVKPELKDTLLSKTLLDCVFKECPINKWCKEQELKNKKIKL